MRILLVLLAIVAVVLAVLMEQVWLYVASGLLFVLALGLLAFKAWQSHRRAQAPFENSASDQDDLNALGIMEIREKQQQKERARPSKKKPKAKQSPEEASPGPAGEGPQPGPANGQAPAEPKPPVTEAAAVEAHSGGGQPGGPDEPQPAASQAPEAASKQEKGATPSPDEKRAVLHPYLQALKAAVGAHTVCLLVQEEVALTYRIEALVSDSQRVRSIGESFSSRAPLLTANLSRQKAALRDVAEDDVPREGLGYYRPPLPSVEQLALAPVSRPDSSASFFLLLDKKECFAERKTLRLLAHFANLLAVLLDVAADDVMVTGAGETDEEAAAVEEASADSADSAPADEGRLPRRQIIDEEMTQARAEERELALALVYLNRAESVASRGEEAVQETEQRLMRRLQEAAPQSRVEHFGELTYGIFYDGDVTQAERWAVQLQREFEGETAPLEGGVSVGLAMLRSRHGDPDALRADATEALREAYTTGTCTILE